MYNRYIPQPDGSYSRRRIQEPQTSTPPALQNERPNPERWQPEPVPEKPEPKAQHTSPPAPRSRNYRRNPCRQCPVWQPPQSPRPEHRENAAPRNETSVLSFLKHLLPKDFDTGDLLIVLLLLLMSGDCQEDQNTAILTLVLYLFM